MKTPRIRAAGAPSRPGYCTEAELAARWGRKPATLLNWRLRPHADHTPVPFEVIDGWLYYSHAAITTYEADPANRSVRPLALRGTTLPPLVPSAGVDWVDVIAERQREQLMLDIAASDHTATAVPDRGIRAINVWGSFVIAVANDGTAWLAYVATGFEHLEWRQLPALPCIRALATLPVHPPRPTAS